MSTAEPATDPMPQDQNTTQSAEHSEPEGGPIGCCTEPRIECRGIRLVLLDIEGTTCPVQFVTETLFPYAAEALERFLTQEEGQRPEVQELLASVEKAWASDEDPRARALTRHASGDVVAYLRQLIQRDSKLPALKALQGLIWRSGYASGELVAPLFADVPEALRRWRQQGLELAVYSSGSIPAQQLLYGHSSAGDLRPLFGHWFDTTTGPKQKASSYAAIATHLELAASEVLFVSDSAAECRAAMAAGMQVIFSCRPSNPKRDPEDLQCLRDFRQVVIH